MNTKVYEGIGDVMVGVAKICSPGYQLCQKGLYFGLGVTGGLILRVMYVFNIKGTRDFFEQYD